jgi:hypothetical protein
MKKVFIISSFLGLFIPFTLSQDERHHFLLRIENNMFAGKFNFAGKEGFEKRFFGDFNARVEFFYQIHLMPADVSGFRIVKKGSSYTLEVKYVSNYKEVIEMFEDKFKSTARSYNGSPVKSCF